MPQSNSKNAYPTRYQSPPQDHKRLKMMAPPKHASPIDRLLKTFRLLNAKVETIKPACSYRHEPNQFLIEIDPSRDDSISFKANNNADYKTFSDGSGCDNRIGSAVILYERRRM